MDLMMLWENFEVIAEAENGIQRLRDLILDLAARGLLVPQYLEEGKANSVLEIIKSERNSWLDSKQRKKEKKLPEVDFTEIPHKIPSSWCWTRLGEVVLFSVAEKCASKDIPETAWLLDLEDIEKDTSRLLRKKQFSDKPSKSTKAFFKSGDILYGKLRPYLNKVLVSDDFGYCTTEILPLRPFSVIIPEYVKYILKRPDFLDYANSKTYGINLPRLGTEDARQAVFPLPPTQEQERIVKKVDELMELCDRAQASKKNRNELQQQLRRSAIHALETAETEEDFKKSWHFVRDNFSYLTIKNQDLTTFRRLILLTAAKGKLVSQEEADLSAEEVFFKATEEKKALSQEGLIPKLKKLSPITEEEIPFKLPHSWKWVRLESICNYIVDCPHRTPKYSSEGYPAIRTSEMTPGKILIEKARKVNKEEYDRQTQRLVPIPGDIFYSREGNFGIAAVVPEGAKICLSQRMMQFRTASVVDPFYFSLIMNSPIIFDQAAREALGMTVPHINIRSLKQFLFPLAPFEEQKRIVSKVDELMKRCDRVEESLRKKEELASAISASVIHHLEL